LRTPADSADAVNTGGLLTRNYPRFAQYVVV
jgi:hypothetical protein